MQINSIQFIKPEEVNAMALVPMEVTKSVIANKNTEVKREQFSAALKFDRLTTFKLNISNDDFALIHYYSQRKYLADQFTVQAHVRVIETKWPEKDGRKAHSSYLIQIYLTDDLKWEFDITKSQFLPVYLAGIKAGSLSQYLPIEKIPGKSDKEVVKEEEEKLPF